MATPRAFSAAAEALAPVYVVFGASGGIGSALSELLAARAGAQLLLSGRDGGKLAAVQGRAGAAAAVSIAAADPCDPKAVEDVVGEAVKLYGRVDGVANCVGSVILKPAHTTSLQEFEDTLRINLLSSFSVLRAAAKAMSRPANSGGGSIVFCSSAVARHGIPNHEAIAAAKGGVAAMALSAAATYAPRNIRVNCVAPGLTRTPMTARITSSEAALKASTAMHALKRIGEPQEAAAAIAFLLDPANSFITGQVLAVDGGLGSVRAS
ncbi:hypothetical protein D9Q98_009689 [Chlorella vulgaris]|uniref:Ketoreductase domain-containing protein n=1 Tax=Chlorella vulgaris TaxID=3077 RepID=A0A9D4TEW3_CHLVU|nr:hypothetical protein D9Q98_009689 [Chlorella vulgaris]